MKRTLPASAATAAAGASAGLEWPLFLSLILSVIIKEIFGASFTSLPGTLSVTVGGSVDFTCRVANQTSDSRVEWWYLNQNLQLSTDGALLTDDSQHFSLFSSRTSNGENEIELRLSSARILDSGYYQCRIVSDHSMSSQINTLIVTDPAEILTTTSAPLSRHHANFTGCCVQEGVGNSCLPICSPASMELSESNLMDCAPYIMELLKCGAGQHNHVPCCVTQGVSDFCLDACQDQVQMPLNLDMVGCIPYIQNLLDCFQEGYDLLPFPPISVTAESVSTTQVLIMWQPPTQTSNRGLLFRVFYRQTSDSVYRSKQLTGNYSEIIDSLQPNTRYRFYVISVNDRGSSQPSYFVEIITHQETDETSPPSDDSLLACCQEQNVDPMCRSFLCTGDTTTGNQSVDLLPCYSDLDKVFQCISGMRNNTDCCIRHGLSPKCYPLCDGQLSQVTFEQLDCFQEMGIISTCFQEGHENIPGHPANVVLDSVSATSAVIRWSPPIYGTEKVRHYTVRYKQYDDPLFTWVSVYGLNYTVSNLSPSTLYEVAVASVGDYGTSLPSPAVVFLTYWLHGFEPATTTSVASVFSTMSPSDTLARCCVEQGVSSECMRYCSYTLQLVNGSDVVGLLPCLSYVNQFLHCVTRGVNQTGCCQSRGIQQPCLIYCSGETVTEDHSEECLGDIQDMLTCFRDDAVLLPSMPMELLVVNKTSFTILIQWQPPTQNVYLVKSYIVSYRQMNGMTSWNTVNTSSTSLILQNLQPDTVYLMTVSAQGEHGVSPATPELSSRTLPVNVVKKINITKDLTDCCVSLNVSESCVPVCAGSDEIALHECGYDLGKIIECAADDQDHTQCCTRMNIPTHCLDFCRGQPNVNSFPSLICVSFLEQIFTCFHEDFDGLPNPPYQFSYTEIGSSYVMLIWHEPQQTSSNTLYNLYYSIHATNTTYMIQGVKSPFRLTGLEPHSLYDIYLVAVNTYGSSPPTATLSIFTSADSSSTLRVEQDPEGYIPIGSKVTLRCFSPEGTAVFWLRQSRQIDGSTYEIDATTEDDGGRYTCVIRGQNADSADLILKIQYAPDVEPRFQSVEIDPIRDHLVHLECRFTGYPLVTQWQRLSGRPIWPSHSNGSRYTTATYVMEDEAIVVAQLSISHVGADDYDWYTCRGSNDFASVTGYVMLTAEGVTLSPVSSPFPPKVESVVACCLQKDVSLDCISACVFDVDLTAIRLRRLQCTSDLPKMIECSADGRNHSKCCSDQLVPSRCLSLCSGVVPVPVDVTCLAHVTEVIDCMEMGHANLPSRPLNLTVSVGLTVSVTWLAPVVNPNFVQYYEVVYMTIGLQNKTFYQVTASSNVRYTELRNLIPFMMYRVTVTAHNHHGSSVPSDAVYFKTEEPVPSSPSNVSAAVVDSVTVQVSWGHPEVNWESVALYYIYFIAQDLETNWSKIVVGQSVFHSFLKGLRSRTVYRIYVTAVSSHFESPPSPALKIETSVSEDKNNVALGVGLFFLFFVLVLVVISVSCWCFKRHRSRFKESVCFENPNYTSLGDGQISLPVIQGRNSIHSNDQKVGSSSDSGGEAVYVDNIVVKEANGLHKVGYATLPTSDNHLNGNGSPVAADSNSASLC